MPAPDYPAPERRLRLGLVGGGRGLIGAVHANGARLSNRWEVVAGALSSDAARARAAARDWLIAEDRAHADFRAMAAAEAARGDGIDAVAIVTPNHLHAPAAAAFMAAGIDVICDKPVTRTLAEAEELQRRRDAAGVIFGVAYVYACHAMVRQARAMVARGDLGELRQVHVEYFQDGALDVTDADGAVPWRLDPERGGQSFTLADIGTHAAHLLEFVTGRPIAALRAEFHVTGAPKAMEDTAFLTLRLEGGVPGTLLTSQAVAGHGCGLRLRLAGSRASLDWHQETPETLILRRTGAPAEMLSRGHGAGIAPEAARLVRMPRGHPEALSDAWANFYLELAVAIAARRAGEELPDGLVQAAMLEDGVRGMRFVAAALASQKAGEWREV